MARRWGRAKRWEYWALITSTHVVGLTISSLDYAGLTQVWVLDRASGEQVDEVVVVPLARGTHLPGTYGTGPASARTSRAALRFTQTPAGTRLRAATARVRLDVLVPLPVGHERLGVVVAWDARTFQYTIKDVGRPFAGTLRVDGVTYEIETGWATLDHGRGYWPRELAWNWGFGAGIVDGHSIGLQLGGRWADGTGSTEHALVVDGRLHKIREELLAGGAEGIGYLLGERVGDVAQFVDTLRRVIDGATVMDPEVIAQLVGRRSHNDPIRSLTPREHEVLGLIAQGLGNAAIAQALFVSETAVSKHIGNVFAKLGLAASDRGHRRVLATLAYLRS